MVHVHQITGAREKQNLTEGKKSFCENLGASVNAQMCVSDVLQSKMMHHNHGQYVHDAQ